MQKCLEHMEKLVVLNDDGVTQEFPLTEKRISLGRDQSNDVCLSDKSVSRKHASVVKIYSEFFLEDEESTNGTKLNGLEIKKHILKNGDQIEIGKYRLRFEKGEQQQQEEDDLEKTVVIAPMANTPGPATVRSEPPMPKRPANVDQAQVRFLSGPDTGETKMLDRAFTTIGRPGGDLILINRRHTGYFLLKMGGNNSPSVNGEPVRVGGVELHSGDKLKLGELELEFIQ